MKAKLLEPSSMTVAAKLHAAEGDVVRVRERRIPGSVTWSPAAASMNTKSANVRPEICLARVDARVQHDAVAGLRGRERRGERRRRAHVDGRACG